MASPENLFVKNLLVESRKRVVGSLMSYMEQNVYANLSPDECEALRQKVLNSVGAYHDVCLDLLKATIALESGTIVNEYALDAIAAMHRDIKELRRDFEDLYEV